MADSKTRDLQNALLEQIDNLDKKYIRGMQKQMFECSAKCCENKTMTWEKLNGCVQRCGTNFNSTQTFISSEFAGYQKRLQRCVSQCNDDAKDRMGIRPTEKEMETVTREFENCACACVDKHVDLLPGFVNRMEEVLRKRVAIKDPNMLTN